MIPEGSLGDDEWIKPEDLSPEEVKKRQQSAEEVKKPFLIRRSVGFQLTGAKCPFGSGTLFKADDGHLIATAGHVVEKIELAIDKKRKVEAIFHTGKPEQGASVKLERLAHKMARRAYRLGEPDVGVVKINIDADVAKLIEGVAPLGVADIATLEPPKDRKEQVFLSGYPAALGEGEGHPTIMVHESFVKPCGQAEHHDDGSWGRDPSADLHLDWSHGVWIENLGDATVVPNDLFAPNGASGGGLWHFVRKPSEPGVALARFVGIAWFFFGKAKCVRGVPAHEWLTPAKERGFIK